MNIKEEMNILIGMIQRPTGLRLGCNFGMYKDDVTKYRGELYKQTMKIQKNLKPSDNSSSKKDCTTCHYWTSYCDLTREKIIRKNCKDYIQRSPS